MMEQRWSRQPLPKTSLALQTRRAGATQTHSRVRRSQPSQSVSQSVRNAKPRIAVLHPLPMVNIISSIITLTITPLIVMKGLLICFSSVLFILIMTRLAR